MQLSFKTHFEPVPVNDQKGLILRRSHPPTRAGAIQNFELRELYY